MTPNPPLRMQVVCHGVLVAEVVGEFAAFSAFQPGGGYWERYAQAKWRAGKPIGSAVIRRADLPRVFDVPVGSQVDPRDCRDAADLAHAVGH